MIEARIAALHAQFEAEKDELELIISKEKQRDNILAQGNLAMAKSRQADAATPGKGTAGRRGKGGRK